MNQKTINLSHISTSCLIRMLLQNLWMIVASALIFAMSTSLVLTWFHTPRYEATMTYAVTGRITSFSTSGNVAATQEVSATLTTLLPSNFVRNNIRDYSEELENFSGTIEASQVGSSNMIIVTSTANTPEEAYLSLCALEELFPTIVSYVSNDCVVQVVRNPSVRGTSVNEVNINHLSMLMGIVGAAAMTLLLIWYSVSRETIQTRTGARHLLDAPIIATISRVQRRFSLKSASKNRKAPIQVFSPTTSFAYTEQINTICAQLEHENSAYGSKLFLVTGVGENEGKSTIAGNVAAALAMMGKKVAVVDCDLRNPSLNRFFDNKYTAPLPLNKLLSMHFTRDSLLQCMQRHEQLGIYMLFPIIPDRRCTELLTSPTMDTLLTQLRVFDYVILDTPPMGYFADTEALVDSVDASMLVVRQDKTPAPDINDAIDLLRRSKAKFLGCVLNDMTGSLTEGHGYGYGYGYGHYGHYGYGSSNKQS